MRHRCRTSMDSARRATIALSVLASMLAMPFLPRASAMAQRVVTADHATQSVAAQRMERAPTMERTISLDLRNVPLVDAVQEISRLSGVEIRYTDKLMPVGARVSYKATNVLASQALAAVLRGTGIGVRTLSPETVVLGRDASSQEVATGTITGKVLNAKTKQPIVGATVLVDAAAKGVQTAEDGTFRIPAEVGEHTVHVRAVGYVKQAKRVNVTEGNAVMVEVLLETSASVLDEVIVTGTVVATERKAIPTPITVIKAEDIEKRGITRMEDLFRGEIPGVYAMERGSATYSYQLGAMVTSNVYVRGSASLNGAANPLKTYIDGVELLDASYLGTIDPRSIERIEIITGPQAATIYGSGAMGGVMQIFTKKGSGRTSSDVTLNFRYGMLQSSVNDGSAPAHHHNLAATGGAGPIFSYSGNLSYDYTGQWQPGLYNRMYGASAGVTHARDAFTVSGSYSATRGSNGVYTTTPYQIQQGLSGEWIIPNNSYLPSLSQRVSRSSSQTVSLNFDYRAIPFWQHHVTVGKTLNKFDLDPQAPDFLYYGDTLFNYESSTGERTSASYNMTIQPRQLGIIGTTITLGFNGSLGDQTSFYACGASKSSTTMVACNDYNPVSVTKLPSSNSWGGFGSWQLGLFQKLYFTLGLRGERNPNYGREHKIDWTPTNGVAYTQEYGDLTMKLLGSYGKATRPPNPSQRLAVYMRSEYYDPSSYLYQFESPDLTPEYSSGPQGGLELYYGNIGTLTINHYQQTVSNLIQNVTADSVFLMYTGTTSGFYQRQIQYDNVGKVRQRGWEGTASLNLGPLTLKGTYTWNDSRILEVAPEYRATGIYTNDGYLGVGAPFLNMPTHLGNWTASYAHGGTSLTLVSNWVGKSTRGIYGNQANVEKARARLQMYTEAGRQYSERISLGYVKSDLNVSQRLSPWATATMNVSNLGNSFGTQGSVYTPALGRQTTLGLMLRMP